MSEPELLQRARHFEPQALAHIYDRFSPGLYRYAMRLLGDENLAEDCVAETFTRFLETLKAKGGPKMYLQAYLYRTSRNWIADHYRRKSSSEEVLRDEIKDERIGSEEKAEQVMEQERVRKALLKLTPDQQQVVVLKYLEGWKNEEIALALQKPIGAVKSLNHRALGRLKRVFEKEKV